MFYQSSNFNTLDANHKKRTCENYNEIKGNHIIAMSSKQSPKQSRKIIEISIRRPHNAFTPTVNFLKIIKKPNDHLTYDHCKRSTSITSIPENSSSQPYHTKNNQLNKKSGKLFTHFSSISKNKTMGYSSVNYLRDLIYKNKNTLKNNLLINYDSTHEKPSKELNVKRESLGEFHFIDSFKNKKMNLLQNRFSLKPGMNKTLLFSVFSNDMVFSNHFKKNSSAEKVKTKVNYNSFFYKKNSSNLENYFSLKSKKGSKCDSSMSYKQKSNSRKQSLNQPSALSGNENEPTFLYSKINETQLKIEKKHKLVPKNEAAKPIEKKKIKDNYSSIQSPTRVSKIIKKNSVDLNINQINKVLEKNIKNIENIIFSKVQNRKTTSELSEMIGNFYSNNIEGHISTTTDFYRIGKLLGKGAFGKVNLCIHKLTEKMVAIKSIKKEFLSNEESKKKIMQEFTVLEILNHKNVIKFNNLGYWKVLRAPNTFYLFLSYVQEEIF